MTVRDVARRTGRSQKTIYRQIKSGKLAAELVTTPQGQLYLIDERDVIDAGLPLVQRVKSDPVEDGSLAPEQPLARYFQNELADAKKRTEQLEHELEQALYVIGIYRGRLDQLHQRVVGTRRGRTAAEWLLVQARNDAEFYRQGVRRERGRPFWARLLGR